MFRELLARLEIPNIDWIDLLYNRLEKSNLADAGWLDTLEERAEEVTVQLQEAAEALLRYTADYSQAPPRNRLTLGRLIELLREVQEVLKSAENPDGLNRLQNAVDQLLEVARREVQPDPPAPPNGEAVVLLHGLGRSKLSMMWLDQNLTHAGYTVHNIDYPSTHYPIEYLVDNIIAPLVAGVGEGSAEKLHFVTHSMGGILVRYLMQYHPPRLSGRVVMLSPPNQGSEMVDLLRTNPLFYSVCGPAGLQLGTGEDALPLCLEAIPREVGIIVGNRSVDPVSFRLIPGDNDGKVSVARARLDGMTDFLVLPHSHTFIMHSAMVIGQTLHFLKIGRFDHAAARARYGNLISQPAPTP